MSYESAKETYRCVKKVIDSCKPAMDVLKKIKRRGRTKGVDKFER